MQLLAPIVKAALIPGSFAFLFIGLIVGVLLLHLGTESMRWGRIWLTSLASLYLILSIPVVSEGLLASLQGDRSALERPSDAHGARVVVALGNGAVNYRAGGQVVDQLARRTFFCVLEAARVYKLIGAEWLVASGGVVDSQTQTRPESEMMRDELVKLGVPGDRVLLESSSRNTHEQVRNVSQLLTERHLDSVVVVTTPAHSARAMQLFETTGFKTVASVASDLRYDTNQGIAKWIPSLTALRGSESAAYEYLALVYERIRA